MHRSKFTGSIWSRYCRLPAMTMVLLLAGTGHAYSQAVVYVDDDAGPGGDGTSWASAFDSLQTALATVSTGEIWVAEGFYTPGQPGDETASFMMKNGVAIYGGFNGTETSLNNATGLPMSRRLAVILDATMSMGLTSTFILPTAITLYAQSMWMGHRTAVSRTC